MTIHDFIFSKRNRIRTTRHLTFWFLFSIVLFLNSIYIENGVRDFMLLKTYKNALLQVPFFLPTNILLVYIFIYLLTPKFILTKKYFVFAVGAFCTLTFCFILDFFLSCLFFHIVNPNLAGADLRLNCYQLAYGIGVFLSVGVAGCVTGIKLSKEWHLQQIENARLAKEEVGNKTRLLKSQIKPAFIFRSLQNLQKKIDSHDDNAAEMVLHLSEIYSYILYDCNDEFVALEKEVSVIQHLISIKELIDENVSEISLRVNGDLSAKYIYPLSVFSVLESRIYSDDKKIIDLYINVGDEMLDLNLKFTKENIISARFNLIADFRQEDILIPLNMAN